MTVLSSVGSLMNIAMALMLARVFPPGELGLFKLFFLYLSLCPTVFLVCGVNLGFSYWAGQSEHGRALIRTAASMIFVQAILGFVLILILRLPIASLLGWPPAMIGPFALSVSRRWLRTSMKIRSLPWEESGEARLSRPFSNS